MSFLLYHYIFSHSLQHLTTQCQYAWRVAPWNIAIAQGRAVAPDLVGRSGKVILSWACGSEDKKESRGQSEGESWKEKSYRRGEEEEDIGVSPTTLG